MTLRLTLCGYLLFFTILVPLSGQNKLFDFGLSFTPKRSTVLFKQTELGESTAQLGLNVQAIISYQLQERWQLQSGIGYQFIQLEIIDYTPTFLGDFDVRLGLDIFNSWFENSSQLHYLVLPINARYQLSLKKNTPYLKLGYHFLYNIRECQAVSVIESRTTTTSLTVGFPYSIRKTGGMTSIGFGYEWASGWHSKLFVEPTISYGIVPIYEEVGISRSPINKVRLLELGLSIGVTL